MGRAITVRQLLADKADDFSLELLSGKRGLARKIGVPDINRPGLALAGHTGHFPAKRVQIVGKMEVSYLLSLGARKRAECIRRVMEFKLPVMIVTKNLKVPKEFLTISEQQNTPILRTNLSTTPFIHRLTAYLETKVAPETSMHATLVDVYGVGLLITGRSGIGKSEAALDLVERGHRLVADDLVRITKRGEGILMGEGAEKSKVLKHHMEIRGIGIIDVSRIFGIRAVRLHKRVEVQVELIEWSKDLDYARTGLEEQPTEILGVKIPLVTIPLVPGKNVSVLTEVVALSHLLRIRGVDQARMFNDRLIRLMEREGRQYAGLDEDIE